MINVSVLITTLNEEKRLGACLKALSEFDDVIVIDSHSVDKTVQIAEEHGVRVERFKWNGRYPKKRQWALDHITLKHDFVFFVDADEIMTPDLLEEIKKLDFKAAGYFVKGRYHWNGRTMKYGLCNNKLALFNRHKVEFPVVNDLDIEGMGEIEGHYQPVVKGEYKDNKIGQLKNALIHDAGEGWDDRHKRYAKWEAKMIQRKAYPQDPKIWREIIKNIYRNIPIRGLIVFCHSYFLKLGFLDGPAGYDFSLSRWRYYNMVSDALKTNKEQA